MKQKVFFLVLVMEICSIGLHAQMLSWLTLNNRNKRKVDAALREGLNKSQSTKEDFQRDFSNFKYSNIRGELRTEKNGFKWYCYNNTEAYLTNGKQLTFTPPPLEKYKGEGFVKYKDITNISFFSVDKNDPGMFIVTRKVKNAGKNTKAMTFLFNQNGEYLNMYLDEGPKLIKRSFDRIALDFTDVGRKYYIRELNHSYREITLYLTPEKSIEYNQSTALEVRGKVIIYDNGDLAGVVRYDGIGVRPYFYRKTITQYGQIILANNSRYTLFFNVRTGKFFVFDDVKIENINRKKYFIVKDADKKIAGVFREDGQEIISLNRGYSHIWYYDDYNKWSFFQGDWTGDCDIKGNEIKGSRHLYSSSSSSSFKSSSSSSSNSSNSGNKTTTIVVEHHRDPVPVQEWVQCHICYGSGRCTIIYCNNGWNPNTRMECLGCRGSGRCSACAGRGGTYMTVYR